MAREVGMDELAFRQTLRRAWLECWIEEFEQPNWTAWFGLYTAKSSVEAAKAQLSAMNTGV